MVACVAGGIPDRVARFIRAHISSVEQLETLLLLRSDPGRPWSSAEVGATLRTLPESIDLRLHDLQQHGLVAPDGVGWLLAPGVDAGLVDDLADCWKKRRVAVIAMIFAEPGDDPARSFADAFRIRRDDD
ncbi:MAG TPA: hypothetical protein VM184_10940 [Gaiellaceae bacterium]|nr:hypothetical protein [Gaiellaceae bacterium]